MTIEGTSKKSPKFLDRAAGFYGRLDECEGEKREHQAQPTVAEPGVFDFNTGMLEDDGTAELLRSKPGGHSSRWRRRSSRTSSRNKAEAEGQTHVQNKEAGVTPVVMTTESQHPDGVDGMVTISFSTREGEDDQVLIIQKERETEAQKAKEMTVVKRSTLRNYRRAFDRAFRRGWETFITNLHSVTLAPLPSSSADGRTSAMVEYR